MTDEDRRALEREARYSAGLAALLECLRDGHEPRTWTPPGGQERKVGVQGLWVCKRCRLTYCPPDTGVEREGLPVEIRPMQTISVLGTPDDGSLDPSLCVVEQQGPPEPAPRATINAAIMQAQVYVMHGNYPAALALLFPFRGDDAVDNVVAQISAAVAWGIEDATDAEPAQGLGTCDPP